MVFVKENNSAYCVTIPYALYMWWKFLMEGFFCLIDKGIKKTTNLSFWGIILLRHLYGVSNEDPSNWKFEHCFFSDQY